MIVKTFPVGLFQSNTYLIRKDENSKNAILIDCGDFSNQLTKYIKDNQLQIKAILLTHGHFDHIGAVPFYQEKGIKVYSHINEDPKIQCKDLSSNIANVKLTPFNADYYIEDNQILKIDDFEIKILFTPGHSSGSCCFIIDDYLFTGDTIFRDSFGRYDFNDSNIFDLKNSLNKILNLEKDYKIMPGHGPSTSVFYEKKNNPGNYYL